MTEERLILTNEETRVCSKCKREKSIIHFYRSGETFQSYCIECKREYNRLRAAEAVINRLGFKDIPLGDVIREAGGLTGKQRTDLRNSLKHITRKLK